MIFDSCLFLLFVSHHQHTDRICIGACRKDTHYFAVIDDSDSVRELQNFLKIRRYKKNCCTIITCIQNFLSDIF